MSKPMVYISDLDHKDVKQEERVFGQYGYDFEWLHCATQEEAIEKCQGAKVFLNQYLKMDRNIFKALPELKCIVRYGVGFDNVNLKDADEFGIQVCNIPDYGTGEVADQAVAHMMALTRKVTLANNLIKSGVWDYQHNIPVYRLKEMTIGVCGVGRIGGEFAKRVKEIGGRVIAYDVEYENRKFPDFIEFVSFEELVKESDIISIHCPLSDDTYHMFSDREFKNMKNTAFIINVSRGGIIDEDALLRALENNEIAGAGIDVVEKEPMTSDNPLLKFDNFLITPHAAWYSEHAAEEMKRKAAEEAVRFLKNEPVKYPVNHPKMKGE